MGKLQAVQDEIGEVTDMMRANIEAVVDRGEYKWRFPSPQVCSHGDVLSQTSFVFSHKQSDPTTWKSFGQIMGRIKDYEVQYLMNNYLHDICQIMGRGHPVDEGAQVPL